MDEMGDKGRGVFSDHQQLPHTSDSKEDGTCVGPEH